MAICSKGPVKETGETPDSVSSAETETHPMRQSTRTGLVKNPEGSSKSGLVRAGLAKLGRFRRTPDGSIGQDHRFLAFRPRRRLAT